MMLALSFACRGTNIPGQALMVLDAVSFRCCSEHRLFVEPVQNLYFGRTFSWLILLHFVASSSRPSVSRFAHVIDRAVNGSVAHLP